MNQHNRDDILYESPRGQPIVELRSLNDRLVLYTEDDATLARFLKWSQILTITRYSQEDRKGNVTIKAYDLYYPKSAKKQLIRALTNKRPTVLNKGGSLR